MSLRVISASAGSGKTQRLATLTIDTLMQGKGVLAITFTRNAAAELRERILKLLLESSDPAYTTLARRIVVGQAPLYTQTIDSLIRDLYQHIAPLLGIPVYDNLIVEEEDTIEVAYLITRQLLGEMRSPEKLRLLYQRLHAEIEEKGRRILPDRLLREELIQLMREDPLRTLIRTVLYKAVQQGRLNSLSPLWQNALDTEPTTARLFPFLFEALKDYRQMHQRLFLSDIQALVQLTAYHAEGLIAEHTGFYDHLLIDEAQDTAPHQWDILKVLIQELRSRGESVSLIGDAKQSIYAWREADFRAFLQWQESADRKEFLNKNFRSVPIIVKWNNDLYAAISHRLSQGLSKNAAQKKASLIQEIAQLYKPELVEQTSQQSGYGEVRVFHISHKLSKKESDARYRWLLRCILNYLRKKGVPPEETAFLVRKNEEIQTLLRLLPDYPLQVQRVSLRSSESLTITFRVLKGELGPVEETYLRGVPKIAEALRGLPQRLKEALLPMDKWRAFHEVGKLWKDQQPGRHAPFWNLFLSELHAFLLRHPMYGMAEIIHWWEDKAQHQAIDLPPAAGVYPILTIHRAKGLAWRAIILPFAEWELLSPTWRGIQWRPIRLKDLPSELAEILNHLRILLPSAMPFPLPLKLSATDLGKDADTEVRTIYENYVIQQAVENLNLHYVATTRPREYLFIITRTHSDRAFGLRGANTWRGFWNDFNLSGDLWKRKASGDGVF